MASVTHEVNGKLSPFGSSMAGARPYWLYSLQANGFSPAMEIVANTPYIICMPNHEDYAEEYNQGGHVTFAASNVRVSQTAAVTSTRETTSSVITLTPTFCRMDKSDDVYAINRETVMNTFAPGSLFVSGSRDVYPFEAYSTVDMKTGGHAPAYLPVMEQMTTGIQEVPRAGWRMASNAVYDLQGRKIVNSKLSDGTLPKGIYVVNGRKVVVK